MVFLKKIHFDNPQHLTGHLYSYIYIILNTDICTWIYYCHLFGALYFYFLLLLFCLFCTENFLFGSYILCVSILLGVASLFECFHLTRLINIFPPRKQYEDLRNLFNISFSSSGIQFQLNPFPPTDQILLLIQSNLFRSTHVFTYIFSDYFLLSEVHPLYFSLVRVCQVLKSLNFWLTESIFYTHPRKIFHWGYSA